MRALLWTMYLTGCFLQLALQMQNSIRAKSNGLDTGLSGMLHWLRLQGLGLAIRMFFTIIMFPGLLEGPLAKLAGPLAAAGFVIPTWGLAGIGGYASSGFLNQLFGLVPGLRAEIPLLVPPDSSPPAAIPPAGGQP